MNVAKKLSGKLRTARHIILLNVRPPKRRRQLSRLIARTLPSPAEVSPRARSAAETIQRDGFVMLEQPFPLDKLARVRSLLEERLCHDGWHPEFGRFHVDDTPQSTNNAHILDVETIPEVVEIANDPNILAIVGAYLGCKPTIDDIIAWWSLPGREAPLEEQFYHRDNDSIRFLKLFIYLSDVGDSEGPHTFVRGSHLESQLLEAGKRFADREVEAAADPARITRFVGPFGTCFLEDTYGLHKGEMPTGQRRLILQVRYTMLRSVFAQPGKKHARTEGYDPYINRLITAP